MNKKAKLFVLGGLLCSSLSTPITASAISLNNEWGATLAPHPNSPVYLITGDDGVVHDVPFVQVATKKNKRYEFYADTKKVNAFFRQNYGGTVTYQPVPAGPIRLDGVNSYSWSNLYELTYRPYSWSNKTFEPGKSVAANTVNCGYISGTIGCVSGTNSGNLNPNGITGHTYQNTSLRDDGSFGGTGSWGEARFLGYSELGNHVDNTYYVMDSPKDYTAKNYPYDANVFNVEGKTIVKTPYDKEGWAQAKLDAIAKLLEQEGMSGEPKDWVNKLSLQTNPYTEAPIFLATRDNGAGYQALIVNAPASATMNIGVVSMKIYDKNNKLLAGATRKEGSYDVKVEFDGQDVSQRPKLDPDETYRVEIIIQNKSKAPTKLTKQHINFDGKEYTSCGQLAVNELCKFEIEYTAPKDGGQTVTLDAYLPGEIYNKTGDNQDPNDDFMNVEIMVNKAPKGDVALNNVYLVEAKTNKVVEHPIQGVEYYLQFKGTYIGESMKGNELSFKVKADITTSVPQDGGGTAESTKTYYTNEIKTKLPASSADEPKTFEFKTNKFKATSSTIKVDATLIGPSDFKWTYNTNTKNDKVDETWTAPINLTLSQVTLDPSSHPGGDYCGTVTVNYWVDFTLAYNMTNRPAEVQKVQVAFYADGNYVTSDTIKVYAKQGKRQYTFQLNLNGNCIKPGESIKVIVNPTHKLSESTMDDNSKSVNWNSKYPEGYCENKTNQTRLKWTQKYLNLSLIENGYGVNVDQVDEKEFILLDDNYEQVTIRKIEMRSKLMTDKKMGPNQDGWVDALNPGKDKIQIKAGYGFDIRITVEYVTNAYQNEKTNPKLKDIPISQLHTPLKPVLLTQNLFINLPSSQQPPISLYSNDIKLETTGPIHETVPGILDNYHWTYTIAERLSPNGTNQMVDSLFIDENTKDGEYTIKVYTSPIFGVPGKTPKSKDSDGNFIQYDPLCASKEIKFEVKGSVYDDLEIGLIK